MLLQFEAVLQRHDAVVDAGVLAVRREVAGAHELEAFAGLGIPQTFLQLGVGAQQAQERLTLPWPWP